MSTRAAGNQPEIRIISRILQASRGRRKAPGLVIRCVNPTTNKALHVGHLRNAFLGSAAAACLEYLGVHVTRHCILEDVGPHMALAIHGLQRGRAWGRPRRKSKPDHEAHFYYMNGRALCTPARRSAAQRPAQAQIEISRAIVPETVLRAWALGYPPTLTAAQRIKSLAISGQSHTLKRYGIRFDRCDLESAETPYVAGFIDHGLARRVLTRRNESVSYRASNGEVILKYGSYAHHESAHLLCFMYRSLMWHRPESVHIAFAGQEWAASMRFFPQLLEDLGVNHASRRYAMAFHGMVTSSGEKIASQSGRTMLADDLFDRLQESKDVSALSRKARGLMTRQDVVRLIIRLAMLKVPRDQDFEFSIPQLFNTRNDPLWKIVDTIARICAAANSTLVNLNRLHLPHADSKWASSVCRKAVLGLSFEPVVDALQDVIQRVALTDAPERTDICKIAACLNLLGGAQSDNMASLESAPSLFSA